MLDSLPDCIRLVKNKLNGEPMNILTSNLYPNPDWISRTTQSAIILVEQHLGFIYLGVEPNVGHIFCRRDAEGNREYHSYTQGDLIKLHDAMLAQLPMLKELL